MNAQSYTGRIKRVFLALVLPIVAAPLGSYGQPQPVEFRAYTQPSATFVYLAWSYEGSARRFNLYRRLESESSYPAAPINSQPIGLYSDCDQIKAIIPEGSEEWNLVDSVFSDNSNQFSPCDLAQLANDQTKFAVLTFLGGLKWRIAVVAGFGYRDEGLTAGSTYYYRLIAVDDAGDEIGIAAGDVVIQVGAVVRPPVPTSVRVLPGDEKLLIVWDKMTEATAFNVYRSGAMLGQYNLIHENPVSSAFRVNLDGNLVSPDGQTFPGYVDFLRWDATTGTPASHPVGMLNISGPFNDSTYWYRVAAVDALGNEGRRSAPVSGRAVDKTPPAAPADVQIVADEPHSRLEVRWNPVSINVDGHVELSGVQGYRVYRYEDANDPVDGGTQVGALLPAPTDPVPFIFATDAWPHLRSEYGDKSYYYRVEAVDGAGNMSSRSASASGFLKDTTPPAPPQAIDAQGEDDLIGISWLLNSEPDIDGYYIYRSLCDRARWVDCTYRDPKAKPPDTLGCSGPFMQVGYVSHIDAVHGPNGPASGSFADRTVPPGSPLCYAYLVKAIDRSQNLSGRWPVPRIPPEQYMCERLQDHTPPEPAVISRLMAYNDAVLIGWVAAPVQDIFAYHVYRSDKESGPYLWIGGKTVEVPPSQGKLLDEPYRGKPAECGEIPLRSLEEMSADSLLDTSAAPATVYWYKVVGVDISGNEADLTRAVPVSTFTFSIDQPDPPVIVAITPTTSPCGLMIRWEPAFDPTVTSGFAVFRCDVQNGEFHQISSLVTSSSYLDTVVVASQRYWYQVLSINSRGIPSRPSTPQMGSHPR